MSTVPGMTEFNHPDNPLLGSLLEAEPEAPITDLPSLDPQYSKDPVSEQERAAQTTSPPTPTVGAQNGGERATEPIQARGAGGGYVSAPGPAPTLGDGSGSIWGDALAGMQRDSVKTAHELVRLENDLVRTQRALQLLALSIAIAGALVIMAVIRDQKRKAGQN